MREIQNVKTMVPKNAIALSGIPSKSFYRAAKKAGLLSKSETVFTIKYERKPKRAGITIDAKITESE